MALTLSDRVREATEAATGMAGGIPAALVVAEMRDLERLLARLLHVTTVDTRAASQTCRLCDAHACGHYEGACPVSRAADRRRAHV